MAIVVGAVFAAAPVPMPGLTDAAQAQRRASGSPGAAINAFRSQNGLRPVSLHPLLQREAEKHSRYMAAQQQLTHGIGVFPRMSAVGFRRPVAENVSYGGTSGSAVVQRWIRSASHRQNMLDPRYDSYGFAVAIDRNGRRWWTLIIGAR